jgi:hypothetical protein
MIIGFIGEPDNDSKMGTGKTLLMTIRVKKHADRGERIIANYGLQFKHEKANSKVLMELVESNSNLQACVLALTEVHVLLESRRSSSQRNITLSYLILQTRKRGVYLYYDSQSIHQVEKRLRDNTDYFVFCKKIAPNYFRYRVFSNSGRRIAAFVMDGRPYYQLYDTRETVVDFAS